MAYSEDDAYSALKIFSVVTSKTINDAGCLVTASMDFNKFSDKVAIFRDAWLSRDYSVDFYQQRRKQIFVYVVVKRFAELVTEALYSDKTLSSTCSFSITVAYDDKFGASQKLTAVTWRFDESTSKKMVWEKFDARNFADVAIDYKVNPDAVSWLSDEPGMSDEKSGATEPTCQLDMLNANAAFIRATTYCKKDYIDTPAGVYALSMSRQCAQSMNDAQIKDAFMKTANQIDNIAKKKGRSAVCNWMDGLEREVKRQIN
ncbi:hypothetical protein G6L12_31395 [Agrobacterium rhizogenes]|nr:hypothetical protein [Rhizobium rhizogenes]NTF79005.1 hypothetical protein [Rhizobium rhizogenes]